MLGPIFNREFLTVPRRARHYVQRTAYLGTLWVVGLTAYQTMIGWTHPASLGETARFGAVLFLFLTWPMLALFLFFSALSAASAVAREKDRRTFVLLLMTDLSNAEIVLGKILGSLLPIWLLLATTAPLLMLVMLLGGVSLEQVIQALLVTAASSLAAASLGGLVALWRDRTFQALALTVLLVVLYLCLARGAALLLGLTWLDPYEAMCTVHDPLAAGHGPAYVFAGVMAALSALLNGWGVLRLRVWNPSGEPIQQRERPDETSEAKERADYAALAALGRRTARQVLAPMSVVGATGDAPSPRGETAGKERRTAHAAPGAARRVGPNPILWREVATRAYGQRPLLVKAAYFVVLALICVFALLHFHISFASLLSPHRLFADLLRTEIARGFRSPLPTAWHRWAC